MLEHGFDPWSRKILHATEQRILWATTTPEGGGHRPTLLKPARPGAYAQQEKPPQWDACVPQLEEPLFSATGEKAFTAIQAQHSQK